jgi:hypothetical protein
MSESLSQLAERVTKQADRVLLHRKSATLLQDLKGRLDQIQDLNKQVLEISCGAALLLEVDPKLRVPKKRLSPRLKTLRKTEEKVAIEPTAIIPPEALDIAGLEEALAEVKKELLKRWSDFAKPERSIQGLESLADDAAVADTVKQLRLLLAQLEVDQADLPTKKSDVEEVRKTRKRLATLANQLIAFGYEEDVLAFLNKARDTRGVPISDVLKNPKLRKWLEDGKHTAHFRIVHESVLSSGFLYRK